MKRKTSVKARLPMRCFLWFFLWLIVLCGVAEGYLWLKGFEAHPSHSADLVPWCECLKPPETWGDLCLSRQGDGVPWREWQMPPNLWEEMRPCRELVHRDQKYRILLVGCSFTEGVGVPQDDTFSWHLQSLLPSCTIDNCGMAGTGAVTATIIESLMLRKHRYDLVLYPTIANHLVRESGFEASWELPGSAASSEDVAGEVYACFDAPNKMLYRVVNVIPRLPGDEIFRFVNFLRILFLEGRRNWIQMCDPEYAYKRMTALMRMQRMMAEYCGAKHCAVNLYEYTSQERESISRQSLGAGDSTPPLLFLDAAYPVDYMKAGLHTLPTEFDRGDHPNAVVHHYYAHRILGLIKEYRLLPEEALRQVPPEAFKLPRVEE